MWEKVIETEDLVSFERKTRAMNIRIEARLNNKVWKIFVTHYDGKEVNYTEEYTGYSKKERDELISELKKMKVKNKKEIKQLKLTLSKTIKLDMVRQFREYNVEKWRFYINNESYYNLVFVREAECVDIDIVLHEAYKPMEKKIVEELNKVLGLKDSDMPIRRNVFLYSHRSKDINKEARTPVFIGKIEFDLSGRDE